MAQEIGPETEAKQVAAATSARLFSRRPTLQTPKEALQPVAAPPPPASPPSKRRPTLSAISGFLSFLLLLAVAAVGALAYFHQQLNALGPLDADKVVVIARGSDGAEIVQQLESEGVINNSFLLNTALVVEGSRSRVRAGEFLFKKNASLREVIDTLVSGKEILHSVSVPEGLTSEQILQRLRDNEFLTGDVREVPKEGSLLPDTYRVSRGMSRIDLVRKMQDEQKKALDQIWARRSADIAVRSPFELVTLASIVEKETGRADERPHVASVFINRLNKRMKLQSDPTIVYGLVGGRGTLGRGILRSEVVKPTPYNTYAIEGLPPGPIANPGRAAMDAVARPSRTRDLYFVADGTGGHAFAETLDQHNRNVLRWRQVERDAKDQRLQNAAPAQTFDRVVPDEMPPAAAATPVAPTVPAVPAVPAPVSPARGQRGGVDLPRGGVFGDLPAYFGGPPAEPIPVKSEARAAAPDVAGALAQLADSEAHSTPREGYSTPREAHTPREVYSTPRLPAANVAEVPAKAIAGGAFKLGAQLDERIVADFMPPPLTPSASAQMLDEADALPGDSMLVPVSAQRRAEQKARAARFGVSAGSDTLPVHAVAGQDTSGDASLRPQAFAAQPSEPHPLPKIIRIYDASEGTARDPLKDKSWDLNSAKDVPAIKPPPRIASATTPRAKPQPQR